MDDRTLAEKVVKAVFTEYNYMCSTSLWNTYLPVIKWTRRITGWGLKESKAWVNRYFGYPHSPTENAKMLEND